MPTWIHLIVRSLAIYAITIAVGTFGAAAFLSIMGGTADFGTLLVFGAMFTGATSIPTIPLLAIGLYLVYKRGDTQQKRWYLIFALCFVVCAVPLILWFGSMGLESNDPGLLFATLPYIATAVLSIIGTHYYYKDKFPPEALLDRREEMDDVLDDGLF